MRFVSLFIFFYSGKRKECYKNSKKITTVYGDGAVTEITARKWLSGLRNGHFDLENQEHFGRPVVVDDELSESLAKNNPGHAKRGLAEIIHIFHMRDLRYF